MRKYIGMSMDVGALGAREDRWPYSERSLEETLQAARADALYCNYWE
ncbi:MAG: hypothetical protein P8L44_21945 [Opitutales bacterium]|nr:hypothetical protein [Opitutales bacterium]